MNKCALPYRRSVRLFTESSSHLNATCHNFDVFQWRLQSLATQVLSALQLDCDVFLLTMLQSCFRVMSHYRLASNML